MKTPFEETLGLPSISEVNGTIAELKQEFDTPEMCTYNNNDISENSDELMEKYSKNMEQVYNSALEKFSDIMDIALSMEASHGAKFVGSAAKFLDIAKNAQNEIVDRYSKIIEMKIKLEQHKQKSRGLIQPPKDVVDGDYGDDTTPTEGSILVDRNDLLD